MEDTKNGGEEGRKEKGTMEGFEENEEIRNIRQREGRRNESRKKEDRGKK
jgi:hypothetical protein